MPSPTEPPATQAIIPRPHRRHYQLFAGALALLAWLGLAAQIIGIVHSGLTRGWSIGHLLSSFVSYFTNLTNLLVAVLLTRHFFNAARSLKSRVAISIDAAAVVWIGTVGAVNALMLRGIYSPHGIFLLGDILCHDVLPIAYPIYWIALVPKTRLPWGDSLRWLSYPALFGIISEVRGRLTHWYPYPFFNADKLGLGNVTLIMLFLGAALIVSGAMVIAIDRQLCDRGINGGLDGGLQ